LQLTVAKKGSLQPRLHYNNKEFRRGLTSGGVTEIAKPVLTLLAAVWDLCRNRCQLDQGIRFQAARAPLAEKRAVSALSKE
jgi:hypothetical protein